MRSAPWRLRWGLLVLVGAVGVHAGRYGLVPPEHHHDEAAHAYLQFAIPAILAAAMLGAAQLAALAVRVAAGRARSSAPRPHAALLWIRTVVLLLLVYVVQETGEALLAGGHEYEELALFGHGAWIVVPLSVAAAALIALALRGASAVIEWATRRRPRPLRAPRLIRSPASRTFTRTQSAVACCLAPRGPPRLSSS